MKMIPLTQGRYALCSNEGYNYLTKVKWYYHKIRWNGYAETNGHGVRMYMHRAVAKRCGITSEEIDHVNGCGLDCRRRNLRPATKSENHCNARKRRNNTSGVVGVHWHKGSRKWRSRIAFHNEEINLGSYDDKQEAIRARRAGEIKYHGKFKHDPLNVCPLGIGCPACFPRVAHLLPPSLDCDWDALTEA